MNINEFLFELQNPQVYTGNEINASKKQFSPDKTNICLVFPDKYEIGMSHYGLTLLYHQLNKMENVNAERSFLPGKPSIETFKAHHMPLFSLENKIPLNEFDIISFSLLSEMNYTNVLQVLDLAGIPLRSNERGKPLPIIAAGGISAVNPEPLREFIDVFGIGDGEVLFPDLIAKISEAKTNQLDRETLLKNLNLLPGVYVPILYPPVKKGRFYVPEMETGKIKKRVFKKIDETLSDDQVIVPIGNVIFDRLNVEIARGCPKNCRFCQAKSYYAPYRFGSLETNLKHISQGLNETGFESFSLSTLSAGDYPYLDEMVTAIPEIIRGNGISFSLSSLRPSTLSDRMLATISSFRRTGITIVAEAGSQRLRNVINKDVTDEEIFQAVELALRHKWQKIKMYFMLGLPGETSEDIQGIVHLIKQTLQMARDARQKIKLHASFSSFVPKPQTPLQWAKRENLEEIQEKIKYIKENLRGIRTLDLDFHVPHNGVVETVLARGDYRVGELLLKAFEKGQIFSAWDIEFDYSIWEELIFNSPCQEFLSEFSLEETLPWDHVEINYKKDYMKKEYQKALQGIPTPACSDLECSECRGCIYGKPNEIPNKKEETADTPASHKPSHDTKQETSTEETFDKIRIFYEKTGDFVFFSQLSLMKYIERLIRKAGISFKCTEGFTPRIKLMSLPPLPVYAESQYEVVELYINSPLKETELLDRLNQATPSEGFKFKSLEICNDKPSLSKDIHYMDYEIIAGNVSQYSEAIAALVSETDSVTYSEDRIALKIDYSTQGQERFAKIYKLIDPEKKFTRKLIRTNVTFKSGKA